MENGYGTDKGFIIFYGSSEVLSKRNRKYVLRGSFLFSGRDAYEAFEQDLSFLFEEHVSIKPSEIVPIEAYAVRVKVEREQATLPFGDIESPSENHADRMEVQAEKTGKQVAQGI